jgi:predicted membrane channel-forming protein YqfA (hemolysin III family)
MISLILGIALIGLVVYLITTFIPMPAPFKTIIYVIAVVILVLYLVQAFGFVDLPLPRYHR